MRQKKIRSNNYYSASLKLDNDVNELWHHAGLHGFICNVFYATGSTMSTYLQACVRVVSLSSGRYPVVVVEVICCSCR